MVRYGIVWPGLVAGRSGGKFESCNQLRKKIGDETKQKAIYSARKKLGSRKHRASEKTEGGAVNDGYGA